MVWETKQWKGEVAPYLLLSLPFLLTIFVVFVACLSYPMLENFFKLYANGAMWFTLGMVAKGHNYGECRKCGKVHPHIDRHGKNNSMYSKHHSKETKEKISKTKTGVPSPRKGIPNPISPEGLKSIRRARRGSVLSPETCKKISRALTGKPSPKRGTHLTVLHRLRIAVGLRESEVFPECLRIYHNAKLKTKLKEFYNFSDDVQFIPATFYEHWFVRKILIEKKCGCEGLITQSGLYTTPEFITNNPKEEVLLNLLESLK